MVYKNNIIELDRFVYSLIIVAYHVQLCDRYHLKDDPFENGLIAVEYFFLLSGFFLARSLKKMSKDEKTSLTKKLFNFLKNKINTILNVHIISNITVILIYLFYERGTVKPKKSYSSSLKLKLYF